MLWMFLLRVTRMFYEYEIRDIMLHISIDQRNEARSIFFFLVIDGYPGFEENSFKATQNIQYY